MNTENQKMKQTEIGWIPGDWELKQIGELAEVKTGNTPPTSDKSNYGDDYFFVSPADLGKGKYILDTEKKLSAKGFVATRQIPKDSILFTCIGSTIGKSGISDRSLTSNQQINAILPNDTFVTDFLFYALDLLKPKIKSIASEQALPLINKTDFKGITIPLPPTKAEQTAIATALSDADAWIGSLEKLIEKKRLLKQGAMQELLKPKEGWVVKRLGDFLKFQVGFPFSSEFFNEDLHGIRLVKNRDLKSDDSIFHYSGHYPEEFLISNGDVLIGMDGDFIPCVWTKGVALLNQRVGRLILIRKISLTFLFYYLQSPLKEIENKTSSTTVKHLSHKDIENLVLRLPTLDDQNNIGSTLASIDSDISSLENQMAKARQIKLGMMQQLLTGKIRLI
jgi:type I restriction enzyme S subunit